MIPHIPKARASGKASWWVDTKTGAIDVRVRSPLGKACDARSARALRASVLKEIDVLLRQGEIVRASQSKLPMRATLRPWFARLLSRLGVGKTLPRPKVIEGKVRQ